MSYDDPNPYVEETPEAEQGSRHSHLRANVKRRRTAYVVLILLAVVTLIVSFVDIIYLDNQLMYVVFALYAILFIVAIILLFSRSSGQAQQEAQAEAAPEIPRDMERALLQCPDCKNVFEYGQIRFHDHKKTAFSCPICGVYSAMPDTNAEPIKVLRPEGDFKEVQYHCSNCSEDLAIGTFGETPLHLVKFRACPNCGQKGHITRSGVLPPTAVDEPDQGAGNF